MKTCQSLEDWIMKYHPKFETKANMKNESLIRQDDLFKSKNPTHKHLGSILYECNENEPCMNAACPVCFREYRKQITYDTIQSIENINEYCVVTIIFYRDAVISEDITKAYILRIKNKLYQQLNRIGFNNLIIGSFEIDYHCDIEKWMPHFHLLIKKDKQRLDKLDEYMHKSNNLNTRIGVEDRPIKIQDLKNPAQQVSYLFKSFAKELNPFNSRRNKQVKRLNRQRHCLYLNLRSDLKHSGLLFSYGANKCKRNY